MGAPAIVTEPLSVEILANRLSKVAGGRKLLPPALLPHAAAFFLVGSARHDLERVVRQRPLQRLASSQGARIQTSRSSSVVRSTGIAFWVDGLDDCVRRSRQEVGEMGSLGSAWTWCPDRL